MAAGGPQSLIPSASYSPPSLDVVFFLPLSAPHQAEAHDPCCMSCGGHGSNRTTVTLVASGGLCCVTPHPTGVSQPRFRYCCVTPAYEPRICQRLGAAAGPSPNDSYLQCPRLPLSYLVARIDSDSWFPACHSGTVSPDHHQARPACQPGQPESSEALSHDPAKPPCVIPVRRREQTEKEVRCIHASFTHGTDTYSITWERDQERQNRTTRYPVSDNLGGNQYEIPDVRRLNSIQPLEIAGMICI
eukprot:250339-Rhodomonas_salina.2